MLIYGILDGGIIFNKYNHTYDDKIEFNVTILLRKL